MNPLPCFRPHRRGACAFAFAAALASGGAHAQAVGIVDHPLPATVGVGDGVEFEVRTKLLLKNHRITGHVWRKGKTVVPCGTTARCVLNAVTGTDAGKYTVEVLSTGGNVVSNVADLMVVSRGWARLGGRPLSTSPTPQQPALALCDRATVAWVDNRTGQRSDIRVHRYSGSGWTVLSSAALNQHTSTNAIEPTIDCADFLGVREPAVAWSEADGPGSRVIRAARLDSSQWVGLGLASLTGTSARRPKLLAAPPNIDAAQVFGLRTHSTLAWEQAGYGRVARWDGAAWQRRGGWPVADARQALTLDPDWRVDRLRAQPALVASIDAVPTLNQAPAMRSVVGFAQMVSGHAAPVQAVTAQREIVGLGWGRDAAGPGVFMAWTEGRDDYVLRSARLPSPGYRDAMLDLSLTPPWLSAAQNYSGTGLRATAFDRKEFDSACASSEPAFAAALSDSRGVQVRIADCRVNPWQWRPIPTESPLNVAAIQIDLRMAAENDPIVATVHAVGSGYELSVWRYYP